MYCTSLKKADVCRWKWSCGELSDQYVCSSAMKMSRAGHLFELELGTCEFEIASSMAYSFILFCSSPARIQENNASLEHGSTQDDFLLSPLYDRGRLRHQTVPKMDA